MLPLAIILLFLAFALLWIAARLHTESGMPSGRIIYADMGKWNSVDSPLYDGSLLLTGKPDYLVQQADLLLPVEVKSGWAPAVPYAGHVYQLAAYCLLVERTYRKRPDYGLLHYRNRTFALDYTPALEARLLDLLTEMRHSELQREMHRSHQDAGRCARCGYRSRCQQSL